MDGWINLFIKSTEKTNERRRCSRSSQKAIISQKKMDMIIEPSSVEFELLNANLEIEEANFLNFEPQ